MPVRDLEISRYDNSGVEHSALVGIRVELIDGSGESRRVPWSQPALLPHSKTGPTINDGGIVVIAFLLSSHGGSKDSAQQRKIMLEMNPELKSPSREAFVLIIPVDELGIYIEL